MAYPSSPTAAHKKHGQNNRRDFTGDMAVCIFSLHIYSVNTSLDSLNPEWMTNFRTSCRLTTDVYTAIVALTVQLARCILHFVSAIYWWPLAGLKVKNKQHTAIEPEFEKPLRISCRAASFWCVPFCQPAHTIGMQMYSCFMLVRA